MPDKPQNIEKRITKQKAKPKVKKKNLLVVQQSVSEQDAFNQLVKRESGGNPLAVNKTSLACGLGQFLPCRKLLDKANINYNAANLTSVAGVKKELAKVPYEVQVNLMWKYIKARYGNARNALAFHNKNGWY